MATRKKNAEEYFDAAYIGANGNPYGGEKRFTVSHPKYKTVRVAAPTENSAFLVAATVWGVPWTRYDVYAFADVKEE